MRRFASYVLLMAVLWVLKANAQDVVVLTSDQGLSNTCIHSIHEDSYHNVWITTRNGLNMYDGARVHNYFRQEGEPTSLLNNIVTVVTELRPGIQLIGTTAGLCYFDYSTDRFISVDLINEVGEKVKPRVVDMTRRRDGSIVVMATGINSYIVKQTSHAITSQHTQRYAINRHGAVHYVEGRDGKEWVVSSEHEVGYVEGGRMHQVRVDGPVLHLAGGVKGAVYVDIDEQGLFRYDEQSKAFVALPYPELQSVIIKNLRPTADGDLLICTDGDGLFVLHENTGVLEHSAVRTAEYDIAKANIEDAMQDQAGNLWIGIYWKGVVVQPRKESAFEYVGRRSARKNTLGTNCVTAIHPSRDGWLWVGTDHCGLYHLSPDGQTSTHYEPSSTPHMPGTVTAIYQDESGTLWLGSSLGQLVCMHPSTGVCTPIGEIVPGSAGLRKIYGIDADRQGNIWLATMGDGLYGYNPRSGLLQHYSTPEAMGQSARNGLMGSLWNNCVRVDGNLLFVGHTAGIDCFRISEDETLALVGHYLHSAVSDLKIDDLGRVWAGASDGLYCLKPSGNGVETMHFTHKDGLCNDVVRSIEIRNLSGGDCEVWASTDNGLSCYNTSTGKFSSFYFEDGLQGNEFTEHSSAQMEGHLYFGGINGLNYFLPEAVLSANGEPLQPLRITGLYLRGEVAKAGQKSGRYVIYDSWINDAQTLHLCHLDNSIALELSMMPLCNNVAYEYSLNGKDWISLGNGQNRIVLSNLEVGSHVLHIRAFSGEKVSEERLMEIVVHAPWYASKWMILIYILLALLALYFIYTYVRIRVREKRMYNERKQEEEIAEARIQFFMNISHEIRTPMTLILAPLEKLRAMKDDEEHQRHYNLIYQNAQRILQLINQMMDVRKIEKGQFKLNYQQVEMVAFLRNLYELFETTAQRGNIRLEYRASMERLDVEVDAPSVDKIMMNLLSNSMKFTSSGGYVLVDLVQDVQKGTFTVSVTDSGIGIGENKERVFERFYSGVHQNGYIGTGIGLNLTYLLVQLHKGVIRVMDNPDGHGTRFEVELPIHNLDNLPVSPKQQEVELPTDKGLGRHHHQLLLVEDDVEIRQYLHSELSSEFSITEAGNGRDAWAYVQRNPEKVDIIITDIMMPLMGGDELCQKVKGNYNTSHIPVIMLSAKNTDADRIAGMSIGADAYMTKPFNVDLLRTTALTILQNHKSLQNRVISAQKAEEAIEDVKVVSHDEQLLDRVMKCINDNLGNPDLSVEFVADTVGVSRVHFHRKLKEITGQTPRDFIRSIRMKQAERLLREKRLDITDVSVATGFRSLSTFSSTFKSIYGMTPTEYMNRKKEPPGDA